VFKSKRVSLLTIFALLLPSSAGLATLGVSAASAASSHTALTSLTVNGTDAVSGSTVNLPAGTTSADVVATVGADAHATVTGANSLAVGNNVVSIVVDAAWTEDVTNLAYVPAKDAVLDENGDVVTPAADAVGTPTIAKDFTDSETYTLNLNVAAYNSSLSTFTVAGNSVVNGSSVDLAPYTTSVDVVATPADAAHSSVVVTGATGLHLGDNTLQAVVSAIDGTSTTYTVNLNVPASDDASSVITVNGEELINGEATEADWGTTSVNVVVKTTDLNATYVVTGATGLTTGDNLVDVVVTAADGVSKEETQITVTVLPNTDTSVSSITVDGVSVNDGDTVGVDALTTDVNIEVATVDQDATVSIQGGENLFAGQNSVSIIVTAADGVTSQEYNLTLDVAFNTDVSLATFTVDGFDVEDNDILDLDPLTTDVAVDVETTDPDASFVIDGGSDLMPGENDLVVSVFAADGVTSHDYFVVLNVLPNTDTSVSSFTVNGDEVADGDVVNLDPFTQAVDVVVATTDADATYVIDGDSNLVVGENTLTLTVTAADDSTTMDYTVTLVVAPSNDASLKDAYVSFVDASGNTHDEQIVDGDEVYLPSNTQSVEVSVNPTDAEATFAYEGGSDLQVGSNDLVITITAPDGDTQEVITVALIVAVGDVTTNSFTVNGTEVEDGMTLDLEPGTESVEVVVETTDPLATTELTGDSGLEFGVANHLVLTVTSVDGTATATYDVILNILPYTDATAKTISVNGVEWTEGTPVEVDAGDLSVEVESNSPGATFAVTGNTTNVSGLVTLTVTVTAQDGETTESYDVEVLASTELEIVAGSVPTDGTIRVGTYAKLTKDQFAGSKVTYQWLNDGAAIDGATGYRYLITADDFGHDIRVAVIKTTAGVAQTLVSKSVEYEAGIIKKAPTPGIKGKAVVGGTLTAVARTWSTDVELSYQWYADGSAIDGATEETFDITPNLVDAAISVGVTGSLPGYATIEKLSAELTVKPGTIRFTTKPSISGTLEVGETLEVDPGSLSVDSAEVSYVWSRNGEEIDNTEATYTLTADDYKKRITVQVVATAEGYNDASAKVKTLSIKAGTFADVPTPTISGSAVLGETLTVDLGGDYPDGTTFKFVWSRNNRVIAGANEEYTVNKRDIGQSIKVRVIATIPGYKTVSTLAEEVVPTVE
jgi:hypothetical protein